jgi:hypothetical protein
VDDHDLLEYDDEFGYLTIYINIMVESMVDPTQIMLENLPMKHPFVLQQTDEHMDSLFVV